LKWETRGSAAGTSTCRAPNKWAAKVNVLSVENLSLKRLTTTM